MANTLLLSPRDEDLLRFLVRTPATAAMIVRVAPTFAGEPFGDERRVRERLQALATAGYVRKFTLASTGGGLANYYKPTPTGFSTVHPQSSLPGKAFFAGLAPSRLRHTLDLAEAITHTLQACHASGITVARFFRDGELQLAAGLYRQSPDCGFQLAAHGQTFNVLLEIDESTESLNTSGDQSLRTKIAGYEAYQNLAWQQWRSAGAGGARPYFRVVFLTRSVARAYHILALARHLARNPDRRLCYAAPLGEFLAAPRAVTEPVVLDHLGQWQALVNGHPTAAFQRAPVRLPQFVERRDILC